LNRTIHFTFFIGVFMNAKLSVSAGILLGAGVVLVLGSGCARWINGNAGEKGMQPGYGQHRMEVEVPLEHRQRRAGENIPPLSQFQRSDVASLGKNSGEERIPNDLVMMSPSMPSGSRKGQYGQELSVEERQQGERLAALAGLEDIFFGYDSATFSNDARERLLHAARWLQADPKHKLMIEGHCDERGTNDYNLVLGEKRARAVLSFLHEQRLDENRLMMVSYGKERPFCRAHDETCYQQNRRGHLIVRH
jgi:peptidoglycan-associated lipoprotein